MRRCSQISCKTLPGPPQTSPRPNQNRSKTSPDHSGPSQNNPLPYQNRFQLVKMQSLVCKDPSFSSMFFICSCTLWHVAVGEKTALPVPCLDRFLTFFYRCWRDFEPILAPKLAPCWGYVDQKTTLDPTPRKEQKKGLQKRRPSKIRAGVPGP